MNQIEITFLNGATLFYNSENRFRDIIMSESFRGFLKNSADRVIHLRVCEAQDTFYR